MRSVELSGFDGATRSLELDPALSPSANAEAWFNEAKKRERAAERVPDLIAATDRVIAELEAKLTRARSGESVELPTRDAPAKASPTAPRLPYRKYRTSGGLEVRIGRSSRDNDELTFRHSSPNDIWMHARAVGGAHVVLRWDDGANSPPAADLKEAASLAALHSKARHAGTVPIDWTRRKYVRKTRGAPAGQVMHTRRAGRAGNAGAQQDALRRTEPGARKAPALVRLSRAPAAIHARARQPARYHPYPVDR
jgi:predicted ribosome quality control (RQC) complex YloA/Tae2 family protein